MTGSDQPFRRVEHHMSTAISLGGRGIPTDAADAFFERIAALEDQLSRFRPRSEISRLGSGEISLDDAGAATRRVISGCEALRTLTNGDFQHQPRSVSGDPNDPVLDPNAYAKGWIVEDAATVLRLTATEFFVNAGGDILASGRVDGGSWRVGVQHPIETDSILGVLHLHRGAVATSGTYERGAHLRSDRPGGLISVTVTGPDLAEADGLSTAVFASGVTLPGWWMGVDPRYGLLTVTHDRRLRWVPPRRNDGVEWVGAVSAEPDRGPGRVATPLG